MNNQEPIWLIESRKYLGESDCPFSKINLDLNSIINSITFWLNNKKIPWFAAGVLNKLGYKIPSKWSKIKAWFSWGIKLKYPIPGAIVIVKENNEKFIGFVISKAKEDNVLIISNFKEDIVKICLFPIDRIIGYYWPEEEINHPSLIMRDKAIFA